MKLVLRLFLIALCLISIPRTVRGDETVSPVVRWDFDGSKLVGRWQGKPTLRSATLTAPRYPAFASDNRSAYFKPGCYIRVKDADLGKDKLRFGAGDTITIEAWVKPNGIREGAHAYVVGKGRTGNAGFERENQGFALRLTGKKNTARISFLFRSAKTKKQPADFHRWTSDSGIRHGTSWHHVLVTYTFGKSDSLAAYLDGKKVKGTWDMGGATDRAPLSDADDILIGASQGGRSNPFDGWMDNVAIYRSAVPEKLLVAKTQRIPFKQTFSRDKVSAGKVLVEVFEKGVPETNNWPEDKLTPSESYQADAFGFFRVPNKYIDTGVREDRPNPYLLRASALVKLPAGKHRLLLRGLGGCRLWIDGEIALETSFRPPITDGHNQIPTDYLDLAPDFRFKPPGNREKWKVFESSGKEHFVVLETIVGAKRGNSHLRPELGETVVALSPEGAKSFVLLAPAKQIAYTDAGWATYARAEGQRIDAMEKTRRAEAFASQAVSWQKRRQAAAQWLATTPEVAVPELPAGFPAENAIDHFLAVKLAKVQSTQQLAKGQVDFHTKILPILEAKCFSCHKGKRVRGGLGVDSRANLLKGGNSGDPVLLPGQPAKSALLARVASDDPDEVMPPRGKKLTAGEIELVRQWIAQGASWPAEPRQSIELPPLTDDLSFLRRLYLDTVGVTPTLADIQAFQNDKRADKRARWIDRLLDDPRWADHWVSYWQDVLAENPNILNPTLNNTGPFRYWIYESMLDNKPMDVFVTELIRMRGSHYQGGPRGFAMASQNDVPMAQKGIILSSAFLGVAMKCARCHDAPAHESTQQELFQLAALLAEKDLKVPKTSSVPQDKLHNKGRKPLIQVTLKPGTTVKPVWPFEKIVAQAELAELREGASQRDRLALLITAPQNERFAQVLANRVWQRFMGRGIVDPVDDWEKGEVSHPELLRWLGREFVRGGYDLKHLARLILNSHAYQRAVDPKLADTNRYFTAPARRRLTAEQIVDSLFHAAGKKLATEEINLDVDSGRDMKNSLNLGRPRRAWQFSSTSNERDRPSLSLPRVQAVVDVLEAFGWRGSRQDPSSDREDDPNVLQPAILANGPVGTWLTRLSDDHAITDLALQDQLVEELVRKLFLKILTRPPTAEEQQAMVSYLSEGFAGRIVRNPPSPAAKMHTPPRYVSWSNHLTEQANEIKIELDAAARRGAEPTHRLSPEWRSRMEDVLWALLNAPEFVFRP